jgi:Flp pilus assembly protein TadD
MLDVELYGLDAGGHHVTNLLFHVASTLLLFGLLRRTTGQAGPSAFVAALFAIHPLHVESVAWVAERKDVLSTLLWLLTVWAWVRYAAAPRLGRYLLVVLLFALGLMAKPMLVTLPLTLLLLDWWPLRRFRPGEAGGGGATGLVTGLVPLVVEKIPLLVLSAISSALTLHAQRAGGALVSLRSIPLRERIPGAILALAGYLWKMLWPAHLSVFYPHDAAMRPAWQILGAALLLAALTAAAFWLARRAPYALMGWLWYVGTLVPVIGLVQVGGQAMADRYTYVPLIGIFIAIAWGAADLARARPRLRGVLAAGGAVAVLSLAVATRAQAAFWSSDIALFERAVHATSGNALAHNNLGLAFFRDGRTQEAIAHYREALRIEPTDSFARRNLAYALLEEGRFAEALEQYTKLLDLLPGDPETRFHMARALQRLGRPAEAVARYTEALRLKPDFEQARNNLANLLAAEGRLDEAVVQYRAALAHAPDNPNVRYNLARALLRRGELHEAGALLEEALRLKPDFPEAHNTLGLIRAREGRPHEAASHFAEALRLRPGYEEARRNLEALRARMKITAS